MSEGFDEPLEEWNEDYSGHKCAAVVYLG